ncbi:MAG: hypothetical protein RMJ66_04560 [Bacteroidia bacterium]|nr:hypothetical protein [Bacteroidia bacterium]MDW8134319.1 hypothetical protein [Bacteroidia bacterium]
MSLIRWGVAGLTIVSLAMIVGLYRLHQANLTLKQEVDRLSSIIQERPVELSTFMTQYQHFLTKLYLAGYAQNWPLAEFYYEELEETAEQVEKLGIIDEGVPVSAMTGPNLLEPLHELKKAIAQRELSAFENSMREIVSRCNSCHAAAGKPYIRFTLPEKGHPPSQIFLP